MVLGTLAGLGPVVSNGNDQAQGSLGGVKSLVGYGNGIPEVQGLAAIAVWSWKETGSRGPSEPQVGEESPPGDLILTALAL